MKQIARLALSTLAGLIFVTTSLADNWSVFNFKGSNPAGTIQGELVLNRDAVRTETETGFRFESPVDFLHLKVSGSSGILDEFTLSADNPNSLTIVKGEDGSTHFLLHVEPVPTDPPPPETTRTFLMFFAFEGESPWGDSVPDRTITGAADLILGWDFLYHESVSVDEVTMGELARQLGAINAERGMLKKHLANGSKD